MDEDLRQTSDVRLKLAVSTLLERIESRGDGLAEEPKIVDELKALRRNLEKKTVFIELFDEFIEHREYELALHVVCDVFQEPDAPLLDEAIFTRIQELHRAMKIDDECCRNLSRIRSALTNREQPDLPT